MIIQKLNTSTTHIRPQIVLVGQRGRYPWRSSASRFEVQHKAAVKFEGFCNIYQLVAHTSSASCWMPFIVNCSSMALFLQSRLESRPLQCMTHGKWLTAIAVTYTSHLHVLAMAFMLMRTSVCVTSSHQIDGHTWCSDSIADSDQLH
jgi:hypothetical protein